MKYLIKIKYILAIAVFLVSCTKNLSKPENSMSFEFFSLENQESGGLSVHPINGVTKKFAVFASSREHKIVRFYLSGATYPFDVTPIQLRMVDATNLNIDEKGNLSMPVSTIIFEFEVQVPASFSQGVYEIEAIVVNSAGEEKKLTLGFESVNYFRPIQVLNVYNGRTANTVKQYLATATCFIGFNKTFTNKTENGITESILTAITPGTRTPATAITVANRPNVYAHIYTDLSDLYNRQMYLVSPDQPWIADSLRILNGVTQTYPYEQMNHVEYVDLGTIDFLSIKGNDMEDIRARLNQGNTETMVPMIEGHSYAFLAENNKIGVLYLKRIYTFGPNVASAAPSAYFHMILER